MLQSLLNSETALYPKVKNRKIRILIFIGSLRSGGKERRLIELLTFFRKNDAYEFLVVMTENEIHYPSFYNLNVPYVVLPKKWEKNDVTVFYQFYKVCEKYQPHLIHAWGRMQTLYTLPAVVKNKIPLINSQITSAPPISNYGTVDRLIDRINFRFSRVILSNSWAGINAHTPPALRSRVIYNGINRNRFVDLPDTRLVKSKYGIKTPYAVLMCASFSPNKDYGLFLRVAERVTKLRDDITFIGVGGHDDSAEYRRLVALSAHNPKIVLPGRISDVEALINACTIGVLFSNASVHGEGISNAVMEYMALAKPVIANDAGGTREIVHHKENGYLITDQSEQEISDLIMDLIDNENKREAFGERSRKIVDEVFSLEKMGELFEQTYKDALA